MTSSLADAHLTPTSAPSPRRWPRWWGIGAAVFAATALVRLIVLTVFAQRTGQSVTDLLFQWDAEHYIRIAEYGYFGGSTGDDSQPVEYTSLAFFPALPGLMRAIVWLTPLSAGAAGMVVAVVAGVAMAAGAAALADGVAKRMGLGVDSWGRAASAVLVCGAPMSITLTMVYTESLFGALAIWSLVFLMERRWLLAGALILACGLVRLTSVDLIAVMAVVVLLRARREPRAWAGLALTPWAVAGYLWWASAHSAAAGGYFGLQRAGWHSAFDFGAATVRFLVTTLFESRESGYLISAIVILAAVVAVVATIGRAPLELWLFSAAITANVVLSDGIMHSRPRLLLPAVVILLPAVLRLLRGGRRVDWWLVAAGWVVIGAWFSGYLLAVFPWAI